MSKIDLVYVIENNQPDENAASGVDIDLARAERFAETIGGKIREFTEKPRWHGKTPDNGRAVLILYRTVRTNRGRIIVARFGSEGKWLAEDHDLRLTYLERDFVIGWREMPEIDEVHT